MGLCIRLFIFI